MRENVFTYKLRCAALTSQTLFFIIFFLVYLFSFNWKLWVHSKDYIRLIKLFFINNYFTFMSWDFILFLILIRCQYCWNSAKLIDHIRNRWLFIANVTFKKVEFNWLTVVIRQVGSNAHNIFFINFTLVRCVICSSLCKFNAGIVWIFYFM